MAIPCFIQKKMSKAFIHKFHVSGMHSSEDVAAVRNRLVAVRGVSAVNVDLRKMQAQITATRAIEPTALRNALGNAEYELSGLTTSEINTPSGVRDDETEAPNLPI